MAIRRLRGTRSTAWRRAEVSPGRLASKTVLRGGYGFYWAPNQYPGLGEAAIGSKGYTGITTFLSSTNEGVTPANTLSNPYPAGISPPQGNAARPGNRRRRRDRLR